MARGIKFAAKPTIQVADVQCKNEYRPTVRVDRNHNHVVNEQKGYKGTYIPPPLQVLISQAFLRGLAEVGFVWNLLGLVHCDTLYVFNTMFNIVTQKNGTVFDPGKKTTAAYTTKDKDDQNWKRARIALHVSPHFDMSSLILTGMATYIRGMIVGMVSSSLAAEESTLEEIAVRTRLGWKQ